VGALRANTIVHRKTSPSDGDSTVAPHEGALHNNCVFPQHFCAASGFLCKRVGRWSSGSMPPYRTHRPDVRSRDPTAMKNEVLAKIICHNICTLIRSMYELKIAAEFLADKLKEPV
jgi:hypothetical protein